MDIGATWMQKDRVRNRMDWVGRMLDGAPHGGRDYHQAVREAFPHARAMADCPQDAVHHAEGNVWTHTCMVVDRLLADETVFGNGAGVPETRRQALVIAAWLHDIGKPATTVREWDEAEDRYRIRQPGHSPLGADMAWRDLIDAGADPALADAVHALVFWHQRPHFMFEQKNMLRRAIGFSCEGVWSDLLRLVRADTTGRIAPNIGESLERLELLSLWLEEQELLDRPWPFGNDEARLAFLRQPERSPWFTPQAAGGSRAVILSGLPGSGKDSYAREFLADLPMVSLDRLRLRMNVDPEDTQGRVVQAAFEEARVHLRAGRDFIWNATCVTRQMRRKIVGLCLDYDASVEIHSLSVPLETALARNEARDNPVPAHVIRRLAARRQRPGLDEAHRLRHIGAHPHMPEKLAAAEAGDPAPSL